MAMLRQILPYHRTASSDTANSTARNTTEDKDMTANVFTFGWSRLNDGPRLASKMKILNQDQIRQKIRRLAFQIVENHFHEKKVILAGINRNGYHFAGLLQREITVISPLETELTRLQLNPANPTEAEITLELPLQQCRKGVVIVVDDVANTGRTIFYAMRPFMDTLPKKIEVAVLVDRKHKAFPIHVDYVGLSLATTMKEDIDVQLVDVEEMSAYLS